MIRIAVCEDDYVYTEMIRSILQSCITVPYEVKFFSSGTEFLNTLTDHGCPYTLVITDIDLGAQSVNGITVAKRINKINGDTQIIFVSQYLEFASDVYDTQHVYFLNKERLPELLGRALEASLKNITQASSDNYLYFNIRKKQHKIPQNDILYMERNLRETTIVTRTDEFKISEKIDMLLKRLPPYFVVCHRSYAVNLRLVSSIHQYSVSFPDGKIIPVGRTHYSDVKKTFALMNSY